MKPNDYCRWASIQTRDYLINHFVMRLIGIGICGKSFLRTKILIFLRIVRIFHTKIIIQLGVWGNPPNFGHKYYK